MKKTLLLLALSACCIFSQEAKSQSFGFSGSLVGYFPKFKDVTYNNYYNNNERTLGHIARFTPGIRIETNYILPGFNIPISGFNGLGFTYFFPLVDSSVFRANLINGGPVDVLGTTKTTLKQINFRFGYEIPQTFNDFLLLHIGWGFGLMRCKTENIIPEKSSTFNYSKSDFDPTSLLPQKGGDISFDIIAGGVYEFESFSLMAQYSVYLNFGDSQVNPIRYGHGLTVGIFYPIKKF